jgi:hypothetical protein
MKIEDVAKQVHIIAAKYEREHNSLELIEKLSQLSKQVETDPTLYGSFSYSPVDTNQPMMGIFHQGRHCLSFTYGNDKLFINYNGKNKVIDSQKSVMRPLPRHTSKIVSETPMIKVELVPKSIDVSVPKLPKCNCRDCQKKNRR